MPFIVRDNNLSKIPIYNKILEKLNLSKKLECLIDQADVKIKVGEIILIMGVAGALGLLLTLRSGNIFLQGIVFFAAAGFPLLWLMMKRASRLKSFIREFPDALDMMTSAIKAGHAFNRAMQLVADEAPDPVGIEFRRTFEQYNLGLHLREALINLTQRVESLDLKLFVTAILLQRETGGNLTEILEKISYTIRERFKLLGQIKTYTAQGRMSAWILGLLPFTFVVIISVMNPSYLTPLFKDKLGHFLIGLSVFLQIIGFLMIRKIVQIKLQ